MATAIATDESSTFNAHCPPLPDLASRPTRETGRRAAFPWSGARVMMCRRQKFSADRLTDRLRGCCAFVSLQYMSAKDSQSLIELIGDLATTEASQVFVDNFSSGKASHGRIVIELIIKDHKPCHVKGTAERSRQLANT